VTSTSISFEAQINPELFDTKYHFQYVQQSQFEVSGFTEAAETSGVDLGSAGRAKAAHGFAGGLAPDTTYRFRVVASNENGEVNTPEPAPQVTTFSIFSSGLPDGRAYEMVTPAHKIGEVFAPEPEQALGNTCDECLPGSNGQMMPMQSAPGGDTVAFQGQPFFAGFSASPNEYLGRRTASGWGAESLSSGAFNNFNEQGYMAFPTDLSRSVIYQHEPALSPDAPTRSGRAFDNLYLRDAGGAIQPLITSTDEPPHRSPEEATPDSNGFKVVYAGANAGTGASEPLSHVVFEANDALTGETAVAPKAAEIEPGERCRFTGDDCNLYEWDEGQLRLVNVLPSNASAAPAAVFGSGHELASPQLEAPAVDHAISDDGSRIFWSTPDGQVYVRIDGQETVEVKDHNGRFLTASPDGKKVVLSDGCLYDLEVEQCEDLTQDHSDVHQGGFTGVLGAAEDLSRVYFIDTKILSGEEANANKEKPEDGAFNLYVWQKNAPATFIGGLLPADNARGGNDRYGAWKAAKANRTAQVSPDGRFLTFMSQAALTGYDNAVAGSGSCRLSNTPACSEVFEYDAGAKTLTCVSCNPTGQRPLGPSSLSLIRGAPALPPVRQPDNLTADGEGRIFFESQDVLSPYDTNGHIQDVYEWEPPGVGGCELARGCVFLISSGHGVDDSMFLDSSETGNDAFFVTRERLIAADKDELLDLYDARAPHIQGEAVGFGESVTAPCEGEACQGAPATPPVFGPPASATFSGPGNLASPPVPKANVTPKRLSRAQRLANALRACAKKPKRQRRACRARAEKRYGPVKAKRKHKDNKGGK
jgi:hypothetical protein